MCAILLVEDHDDTRRVFAKLLTSWGHEVSPAANAASGLAFLDQHHADVILSDIGLPDSSGYDFMAAVRRTDQHVIGIAITAYGMAADLSRSREAGFDMHFAKPVDLVSLQSVLADMSPSPIKPPGRLPPQRARA
jgi:CheY-like chemotaxis protein